VVLIDFDQLRRDKEAAAAAVLAGQATAQVEAILIDELLAVCRGTWTRVTLDRLWHSSVLTDYDARHQQVEGKDGEPSMLEQAAVLEVDRLVAEAEAEMAEREMEAGSSPAVRPRPYSTALTIQPRCDYHSWGFCC
jgi:hypothetical protein